MGCALCAVRCQACLECAIVPCLPHTHTGSQDAGVCRALGMCPTPRGSPALRLGSAPAPGRRTRRPTSCARLLRIRRHRPIGRIGAVALLLLPDFWLPGVPFVINGPGDCAGGNGIIPRVRRGRDCAALVLIKHDCLFSFQKSLAAQACLSQPYAPGSHTLASIEDTHSLPLCSTTSPALYASVAPTGCAQSGYPLGDTPTAL